MTTRSLIIRASAVTTTVQVVLVHMPMNALNARILTLVEAALEYENVNLALETQILPQIQLIANRVIQHVSYVAVLIFQIA